MSDRKSSYKLVCDSPRLRIRELTLDDTAFIIELLNQDSFIRKWFAPAKMLFDI